MEVQLQTWTLKLAGIDLKKIMEMVTMSEMDTISSLTVVTISLCVSIYPIIMSYALNVYNFNLK